MPDKEAIGGGTATAEPTTGPNDIMGGFALNKSAGEVLGEVKADPSEETGTGKPEDVAPEGIETEPETEVKTEVQPEAGAPKEEVLLAGKFKTAKDLEIAYDNSSKEGLRLHKELQKAVQAREQIETELNRIKLENEIGSFVELTDEDLEALSASEDPKDRLRLQRYLVDEKFYKEKKARLESERGKSAKEEVRNQAESKAAIQRSFDNMKNDPKAYPEYANLLPLMDELFDKTGGVFEGSEQGPEALYLMALGIVHLESLKKSSSETAKATEKAKLEASAKAKAAGSSGGAQTEKPPVAKGDGDFVDQLVGANRNKRLFAI